MADGLIVAAPRSGSGKTLVTLGLIAALRARGLDVAPAKTGPDYIDAAILTRTAGRPAINLDPWAMSAHRLRALAAAKADLLLVEGVMGLFDGAADGTGSTGDLAAALNLPVVLVVDADRQSQSIAPLVAGFANWRPGVTVAGIIINRVATTKHETMLRRALTETNIPVLGVLPRRETLHLPDRHLGLVLPDEIANFDVVVAGAAEAITDYINLDALLALAAPSRPSPLRGGAGGGGRSESTASVPTHNVRLPPLGQRIAIARDDAFAFLYPHWLMDWRTAGAELTFFSPLADEPPNSAADAVFLPGGYPELHAGRLAATATFTAGLTRARDFGALIYGECGGFMVLGETLTDASGVPHRMTGLLPVTTSMERPRRHLGYRRLAHASPLPWPERLFGHEFHYSTGHVLGGEPLFLANDALGELQPAMGAVVGRVMGSYAHVIDAA